MIKEDPKEVMEEVKEVEKVSREDGIITHCLQGMAIKEFVTDAEK